MGKIKTKDAIKGTIKQLDRAAIASDRMRRAYVQTKDKAETSMNPTEGSVEEYASTRIESGVETVTHMTPDWRQRKMQCPMMLLK